MPELIVLHGLVHLKVIALEFTCLLGLHVSELAHDQLWCWHGGSGWNDHRSKWFGCVGTVGSASSATWSWWKRSSARWKHGHGSRREAASSTWHRMHWRHPKARAIWRWHHTWWEHHWSSTSRHHLRWVWHVATWWLSSSTWYRRSHHVWITHWRRTTLTRIGIPSPLCTFCTSSWCSTISIFAPGTFTPL